MPNPSPILAVVDTNVPLVANGKHKVSIGCKSACVHALNDIMQKGQICVDSKWLIINEYKNKLSQSGQPGPGDAFLKWVLLNWNNPNKCSQVRITSTNRYNANFKEFPSDPDLQDFDPSDRKFIAIALTHNEKPAILQATDSKWWGLREVLARNKVIVRFLCPDDIKKIHNKKKKDENE